MPCGIQSTPRMVLKPVRSIWFAAFVLVATNVAAGMLLLPTFPQLLLNTCTCVYIGCILSTRLPTDPKCGALLPYNRQLTGDEAVITMKEAKQFPVYASMFLFGFYLLFKVLPKEIFKTIINIYFSLTTVISVSTLLVDILPFSDQQRKNIASWDVPSWLQGLLETKKINISTGQIACMILASIPVGFFFVTRHWSLNNIFGVLFTLVALKTLSLSTTKTGLLLLWALFFYDIFWVYGTDVMVTVAKNLDIPIKLQFPHLDAEGEFKTSMVGLGDLVIPGIFISLCLKFDIDNALPKSDDQAVSVGKKWIPLPYFELAFVGYIYGIIETFLAMFIFNHPQPALLFLVPMCTIPVLLRAAFKGELMKLIDYDTELKPVEDPKKQEEEIKDKKQ